LSIKTTNPSQIYSYFSEICFCIPENEGESILFSLSKKEQDVKKKFTRVVYIPTGSNFNKNI
jgi:purine nucleoside permease